MTIRLPISESFLSLQGEGLLTGVPSFFIRLSGCNLRCTWCDTPHASWSPDGKPFTLAEILAKLDAYPAAQFVKHVVITGGEPFIFAHLPELCTALRERGMHITIETAGTVFTKVDAQLMSISPKLRNSTPWNDARDTDGSWAKRHEERRINLDALAALMRGPWEYQLKFVVSQASDLQEIEELLTTLNARMQQHAASLQGSRPSTAPPIIDRQRVLLMPEGIAPAPPGSRDWLVRACIEGGFRYCHRVHVELFGHKRGT